MLILSQFLKIQEKLHRFYFTTILKEKEKKN